MKVKVLIGCVIVILFLLVAVVSLYPDWLWFKNLQFSPVFWTMLMTKFGFGFVIWAFLILIITFNLIIARRLSPAAGGGRGPQSRGLIGRSIRFVNEHLEYPFSRLYPDCQFYYRFEGVFEVGHRFALLECTVLWNGRADL